ncbi:hypothetical protein F66182_5576 [Fusarium sp. NRRL 66182]|nr:hypothetical protein F66182_5576 [Fusarium sp. NRRL 66182]
MTKVLLTGGSGFIAAHTLQQLLEKDYTVVTTVRSEDKAQKIRDAFPDKVNGGKLEVVLVPDIAKPDAFDKVAKTPGLEAVLHVASPFHFNITDPKKDLVDPAVIGTTGILKALHASAPGVKRVVITSSFAAIIDEAKFTDPSHTFSEKTWNPVSIDDIGRSHTTAYRASKTLAERAAWDFVAEKKPSFDLVTVNPPLVLGPVATYLATLESINTSNDRIVRLLSGGWKGEIPPVTPVPLWIDVRDAARAHVRGLEEPAAGGKRLFTTAGWFSHREAIDIVAKKFPEFKDRLPGPEIKGGEIPPKDQIFQIDSGETEKLLKIDWISFEQSMTDLVETLKELGI